MTASTSPPSGAGHGFAVARGDVVAVNIGFGEHYYLIVSNNARNRQGGTFIGVRLTSRSRWAGGPTVVQLSAADGGQCLTLSGDPMGGWVLCDRITEIPPPPAYLPPHGQSPTLSHQGRLTAATMLDVDAALRIAIF